MLLLDMIGLFGTFIWGEITHHYYLNAVCGTWPFHGETSTNGAFFTCFALGIPVSLMLITIVLLCIWLIRGPLTDIYNRCRYQYEPIVV